MVAPVHSSFFERNTAPLSFTASTMALLTLRPFSFLIGVVGGMGLHHYKWVQVKKDPEGRIIPILSAIFAIIGALAALVSYSAGGLAIHSIVLLSSATIGMTLYRAVRL